MEWSSSLILASWPIKTDPLDQKGASSSPPVRSKVLLFVKTGQGKSSIANMLVSGELLPVPLFPTGDGMCGANKVVATHNGRGFHVADTVGLGEDPAGSDGPPASELICTFLKETKGEYRCILFVTPAGRFDHLDADIAKLFPTISEGAEPAFGVVVTKCPTPRVVEENRPAYFKPKYATATDAGLKVHAMKIWSMICDFFKYQVLQRRRL